MAFERKTGLEDLALTRAAGLEDLTLARSAGLAFVPSCRFVSLAFARTNGFGVFDFVLEAATVNRTGFFDLTLEAPFPFAFVALRAGAFVVSERLAISFGRADLPVNGRLFKVVLAELRREAEVDTVRLTPFIVGSLMRCSSFFKKTSLKPG